ncbi:MAG TPA: response regulator [Planctomycetota bacterium]|nr:response regulator [Planctomycetota bacterium]
MKTVLLVDDDATMLELMRTSLEGQPLRILEARDGEAALRTIWREHVDAMVLDWMLPGLAGIHVLRSLARHGMNPPTIMLTAKSRERDVERARCAGVEHYMTKPFSPAELAAKVEQLLA